MAITKTRSARELDGDLVRVAMGLTHSNKSSGHLSLPLVPASYRVVTALALWYTRDAPPPGAQWLEPESEPNSQKGAYALSEVT